MSFTFDTSKLVPRINLRNTILGMQDVNTENRAPGVGVAGTQLPWTPCPPLLRHLLGLRASRTGPNHVIKGFCTSYNPLTLGEKRGGYRIR